MPSSKDKRPAETAAQAPLSAVGGGAAPGGTATGGRGSPASGREFSDEELVQRMREGEAAAGETLCRRYHTALFRYLQRLTRSDHLAEELFQQTWLSVLEHLEKFDPASSPGGFKSWLFRIATNKGNDLWRTRGRERSAHAGLRLVTDQETASAETGLSETERVSKLKKAIEALPEPQRQVLMLRYYSGLKFVEIAKTLGCPLNTALGRMHKAVLKLKATLDEG
jgi:RNA polymerase sigma-70 factor, ECF subfamily